jgi:hypothetical protein
VPSRTSSFVVSNRLAVMTESGGAEECEHGGGCQMSHVGPSEHD